MGVQNIVNWVIWIMRQAIRSLIQREKNVSEL